MGGILIRVEKMMRSFKYPEYQVLGVYKGKSAPRGTEGE